MFITSRTETDLEKNYFLSNSTVGIVPENDETFELVEMLQEKLPGVDFLYFKVLLYLSSNSVFTSLLKG